MRLSQALSFGVGMLLATQASAQAQSQQAASFPPACAPFMATGASVNVDPEMLKSLASVADRQGKGQCAQEIRQLQNIQAQMDEYRKNGSKLAADKSTNQMAILNSSFEATQRMLSECQGQAESMQMVQAGLDVTGIALFTILQNNPGVWLVSAAVDALRRLGSLLTDLFTWKTLEEKATERVADAEIRQRQNALMQRKMCLYVTYMDAVAALEDGSRQRAREQECRTLSEDPVCSSCYSLQKDVDSVKDRLAGLDEASKCRVLRWEITGLDPPALDEAALAFGDTEGAAPVRASLPASAAQLVRVLQQRNPNLKKLAQSWSTLDAKARAAGPDTAGGPACQELNQEWGKFLVELQPYVSREEFQYFVNLKRAIDAYKDRKNQFSEGTAIEVSNLLLNVQFFDHAKEKSGELEAAGALLSSQVKKIQLFGRGEGRRINAGNFCMESSAAASRARIAIREIESSVNMCKVLLSKGYDTTDPRTGKARRQPLFGEAVNPLKQSDIGWIKGGEANRALRPLCSSIEKEVGSFSKAYLEYSRVEPIVRANCKDGDGAYSIEWPNSLRQPETY